MELSGEDDNDWDDPVFGATATTTLNRTICGSFPCGLVVVVVVVLESTGCALVCFTSTSVPSTEVVVPVVVEFSVLLLLLLLLLPGWFISTAQEQK